MYEGIEGPRGVGGGLVVLFVVVRERDEMR